LRPTQPARQHICPSHPFLPQSTNFGFLICPFLLQPKSICKSYICPIHLAACFCLLVKCEARSPRRAAGPSSAIDPTNNAFRPHFTKNPETFNYCNKGEKTQPPLPHLYTMKKASPESIIEQPFFVAVTSWHCLRDHHPTAFHTHHRGLAGAGASMGGGPLYVWG